MALYKLRKQIRLRNNIPNLDSDSLSQQAIGFASMCTRIYGILSSDGQNRLKGMLIDGLKTDKGLLSLEHEIAVAVHFLRDGWSIAFKNFETGIGADYVARRNGKEIEIECKHITEEIGQRIPARNLVAFGEYMESEQISRIIPENKTTIVRIKIPDRLEKNQEFFNLL